MEDSRPSTTRRTEGIKDDNDSNDMKGGGGALSVTNKIFRIHRDLEKSKKAREETKSERKSFKKSDRGMRVMCEPFAWMARAKSGPRRLVRDPAEVSYAKTVMLLGDDEQCGFSRSVSVFS